MARDGKTISFSNIIMKSLLHDQHLRIQDFQIHSFKNSPSCLSTSTFEVQYRKISNLTQK